MTNEPNPHLTEENEYIKKWRLMLAECNSAAPVCFSLEKIQEVLSEIQSFIFSGLPHDHNYDLNLRAATDAIFEAHLLLAQSEGGHVSEIALQQVSEHLCKAIRKLCTEPMGTEETEAT
jgi:hypothetical protein